MKYIHNQTTENIAIKSIYTGIVIHKIKIDVMDGQYNIIMTSYLAITCPKHFIFPEKQLRVFLSYLPQEQLKEYLLHAKMFNDKKNRTNHELTEMIITGKDNKSTSVNDNFDKILSKVKPS